MKDKLTNITRYTYDKTAFQGWRLCLTRKAIKAALRCAGADPQEVFARFKEGKMTPQKGGEA